MHPDLASRRRVLLLTYQRYLAAERAWIFAQEEMRTWFPATTPTSCPSIGNPGSYIRRIYEQRERSVHQLEVARLKLEIAKQRLAQRHQGTPVTGFRMPTIRLINSAEGGNGQGQCNLTQTVWVLDSDMRE